jgi:hypothetical protein
MSEELNEEEKTETMEVSEESIKANTVQLLKEKYTRSGLISIKPYVNPNKSNMGLEKYHYVVHPGTHQNVPMTCIMYRGKKRYLNGLDEYAPEVKSITDKEEKAARIHEIRTIVAELELEKTFNTIDINDKDFWNKVETFRPDNSEVWAKMAIECGNNDIYLNPGKNTDHLLMVLAIEAGGYPDIAKSFDDVKSSRREIKWYLDKQSDTVETRATSSKIKNKALAKLDEISEVSSMKLFFIIKLIMKNSIQYKASTLPNIIYDDLDGFINGENFEPVIKKAANQFMALAELELKELKIRAIIKDANMYNYLIPKGDGLIYTADSNIMLGRNVSDVYEKLTNPLNEDALMSLIEKVEKRW